MLLNNSLEVELVFEEELDDGFGLVMADNLPSLNFHGAICL